MDNKVVFSNGFQEAVSKKTTLPDILKVFAVLSVMMQGLLGLMMKQNLNVSQQAESVVILDFIKYSAPFFIFAICFDISKIKNVPYKTHMVHKFKELLVPYFCWATVYILMNLPKYNSVGSLLDGYLLGNNAPHTWYLVMMFQFHILVPVLWYLFAKLTENEKRAVPVLIGSFLFYLLFVFYYDHYVFQVTDNKALLYLDRSFIGFSIYAILGTVASANIEKWDSFVSKVKLLAVPGLFLCFLIANNEMFSFGMGDLKLSNSIYLRTSNFFYNVFAILAAYGLGLVLIKINSRSLRPFRFLAQYAYRAYLANYFVTVMLVTFMGNSVNTLPYGLHIFLVWLMTAVFSFTIVYGIEYVLKYLPAVLKGRK